MTLALALAGWAIVAVLAGLLLAMRRRLDLVADAEHELRGAASALTLADGAATHLERLRAGLDDLAAARRGAARRPLREVVPLHGLVSGAVAGWSGAAASRGRRLVLDWRAGRVAVTADRGRLTQLLSNLVANALEHGAGTIELRGERRNGTVRIEVRNESRHAHSADAVSRARDGSAADDLHGRGLRIARHAAEEAEGSLALERGDSGARAVVELPAADR